MPQVRKLTDDDVRTIERKTLGQRKATELEYDRYLAEYAPGDYGEVTLEANEKRLTVRNRLKAAAGRHSPPLALEFRRTQGNTLRFHVKDAVSAPTPAEPAPTSVAEVRGAPAAAPAARKRGPRKTAEEAAPAPAAASRPRKPRKTTGA